MHEEMSSDFWLCGHHAEDQGSLHHLDNTITGFPVHIHVAPQKGPHPLLIATTVL